MIRMRRDQILLKDDGISERFVSDLFVSEHLARRRLCGISSRYHSSSNMYCRSFYLQKVHSRTAARWRTSLSSGLLEPWLRFSMRAQPMGVPVRASRSGDSDSSSPDHRRSPPTCKPVVADDSPSSHRHHTRPGTDVLSGLSVAYPVAGRGPGPRPDPFSR